MKIHLLLLTLFLVGPAMCVLQAEDPRKQSQEETELEGKMNKMADAWRKLKRQVADGTKNADSLQLLATIRAATEESAKLIPAKAADFSGVDHAKFVADFQAKMKTLGDKFAQLEEALKAGRNDEAVKLTAEIGAMQKAGHKEFKRPE